MLGRHSVAVYGQENVFVFPGQLSLFSQGIEYLRQATDIPLRLFGFAVFKKRGVFIFNSAALLCRNGITTW